jgi:hypothetical protein
MSELRIKINETVDLVVTARESDAYTGAAFLRLEKQYANGEMHDSHEAFISPMMLEQIGRFLIKEAESIRVSQQTRDKSLRI